jgi:hypothetical protein
MSNDFRISGVEKGMIRRMKGYGRGSNLMIDLIPFVLSKRDAVLCIHSTHPMPNSLQTTPEPQLSDPMSSPFSRCGSISISSCSPVRPDSSIS